MDERNQVMRWADRLTKTAAVGLFIAAAVAITVGPGIGELVTRAAFCVPLGWGSERAWTASRVLRAVGTTQDAHHGQVKVRLVWPKDDRWIATLVATQGVRNFGWQELARQVHMTTGEGVVVLSSDEHLATIAVTPPRPFQWVRDVITAIKHRNR